VAVDSTCLISYFAFGDGELAPRGEPAPGARRLRLRDRFDRVKGKLSSPEPKGKVVEPSPAVATPATGIQVIARDQNIGEAVQPSTGPTSAPLLIHSKMYLSVYRRRAQLVGTIGGQARHHYAIFVTIRAEYLRALPQVEKFTSLM